MKWIVCENLNEFNGVNTFIETCLDIPNETTKHYALPIYESDGKYAVPITEKAEPFMIGYELLNELPAEYTGDENEPE